MVTIPYFIGKKLGSEAINYVIEKYPKAQKLRDMHKGNDFLFTFLVRMLPGLPSDVMSIYMGAIGISYREYLLGCVLGMLPTSIAMMIMGDGLSDITSPTFIVSIVLRVVLAIISITINYFYQKKHSL